MRKRYLVAFLLFFITTVIAIITYSKSNHNATPLSISNTYHSSQLNVVLLPLDSRPACTQFVVELAQLANINIITPPSQLMDHYKIPANTQALRNWLYQSAKNADAAIISVDMLIHGSLLASRQATGNSGDIKEVIQLLKSIHKEQPKLQLYVFSIIPRLLIADNQTNTQYQKDMLQYSILKDQIYTFENPKNIEKLNSLEQKIPPEIIERYTFLYKQNTELNLMLMNLVEQKIITKLVIGQDDGQPFGMPNISKQRLSHILAQKQQLKDKVFITRGTDEIALTIIGNIAMQVASHHPKIFVAYSDHNAPQVVMPFMPHSVATTVKEKIDLIGGIQVTDPDDAEFILFVHIGTQNNTYTTLPAAAQQIQSFIDQGYKIALVDLSEDFLASETIFPILLKKDTDLTKLIAYAGWNTTSNSVGTAVTQASIFAVELPKMHNTEQILKLYKGNLEFLTARFLDDWYYLKEVQPAVNKRLNSFKIDPYNLDDYYQQTDDLIRNIMHNKTRQLLHSKAFNHPFTIYTDQGPTNVAITDITTNIRLPWQRTFEIYLKPTITLSEIHKENQ